MKLISVKKKVRDDIQYYVLKNKKRSKYAENKRPASAKIDMIYNISSFMLSAIYKGSKSVETNSRKIS